MLTWWNSGRPTQQFEVAADEPWILHPGSSFWGLPGEYVLDSTIAARSGKVNRRLYLILA